MQVVRRRPFLFVALISVFRSALDRRALEDAFLFESFEQAEGWKDSGFDLADSPTGLQYPWMDLDDPPGRWGRALKNEQLVKSGR